MVGLILLAALFGRLGLWQLDRAEQAEAMRMLLLERPHLPPLVLGPHGAQEPLRRAVARGHFEPQHRVLLDNRKQAGRLGRHTIVPLRLAGSDTRVLVNLGWVARGEPARAVDTAPRTVSGLLTRPALPALRLGSGQIGEVVPYLDPAEFAAAHGFEVLPLILVADPALAESVLERQQERGNKWGMHIGYAVQWFAFALMALALPLVLARRRGGQR